MKTLCIATVGSRLHGLNTDLSDHDEREVYARDARDMLNLFQKEQLGSTPGGDYERYEIGKFVQMCAKGNPTALEILFSNQCKEVDERFSILKDNTGWFIDSVAVRLAHIGYINASIRTLLRDAEPYRKRKAYIAGERIFVQGWSLLSTGTFSPRLSDDLIADLLPIKMLGNDPLTDEKTEEYLGALRKRIDALKTFVAPCTFKADTDKIMNVVYDIWGV